jgi:hypothetical protein
VINTVGKVLVRFIGHNKRERGRKAERVKKNRDGTSGATDRLTYKMHRNYITQHPNQLFALQLITKMTAS